MNYREGRYNASGCIDMTAYLALRNIERSKKETRREIRQHRESTSKAGVDVCRSSVCVDTYNGPQPCKGPKTARKGKQRQTKRPTKPCGLRRIKRPLTKRAAARKDGERYGE